MGAVYTATYTPTYGGGGGVFPDVIMDERVELQLGGVWTGITSYVYERDKVTIVRGHPDESTQTNPSVLSLTLNNRDGRFSSLNPLGAYYGQIGRNTPIRVSVPEGATYLRSETDRVSYASTPDNSRLHIIFGIEIQIDATLDNWNQNTMLACKWAVTGDQRSWMLTLNEDGTVALRWSHDGTNGTELAGVSTASVPPPPLGRLAVKATLDTSTGTVAFYTAPTIAGSWAQLGAAVVCGANWIFSSTAPVQVGYGTDTNIQAAYPGFQGKIHGFALLSGIGGTAEASPDFTTQTVGATSFTDAQGNTWTPQGTAGISDRRYRFHGEVSAWPQKWDPTGTDVYTQITASGVLRRIGKNTTVPLNSALYRGYVRLTGAQAPLAYWPLEDGAGAAQFASAIGGPAMTFTGAPSLAAGSDFLCSQPLPQMAAGSAWTGNVPRYTQPATPANMAQFLLEIPSGGITDASVVARMYTTGTVARTDLMYGTINGGSLRILGYDASGSTLFDSAYTAWPGLNGGLLRISIALATSGSNITWHLDTQQAAGGQVGISGTCTAAAVGRATSVILNPGGTITSATAGHVSVQSSYTPVANLAAQLDAWQGETAGNRFSRLCGEEGLAFRARGSLDDTIPMGPQTAQTLITLLQECEDADRGMVFEPRQCLALGYRTRVSVQNQAPAVTLAYGSAQLMDPLEPIADDQFTVNDVTCTRSQGTSASGSSSRQTLSTGPLSTQEPPDGVGRYDTAYTINLYTDLQLDDEAGWLLHMGTVDEPRYPAINVDLARSEVSGLFYQLQDVDLGDMVAVTGTPAWLPPDGISQIAGGLMEVVYGYIYTIGWNCVPASPYNVAISDDAVYGRADTDGSTLHASITSGATSMSVDTASADSPLWTTAGGDVPFDIAVAGERMTVTAVSGSSSPQTFTVTRAVNGVVKPQTAGTPVSLFYPPIASL